MAREYAQIKLAIWTDDDWRDLSPLARYLYLTLLTSPTLSHCGVADWRPARIGALNGMDIAGVCEVGGELVESLHLVIDEESEEVLIRSFIRNDGLMKQPRMAVSMANAHAAVASKVLRGVLVHELRRLHEDYPDLSGWGKEQAAHLLSLAPVDPSTYPLGKGPFGGHFGGSFTPGLAETQGSVSGSPTPSPTPAPTPSNLTPSDDASSESEFDRFDDFWTRYPRTEAKAAARKAWKAATKKIDAETLVNLTRSYAVRVHGSEKKFIPHASTWLNQERWEDEIAAQEAERQADDNPWGAPRTPPDAPPEIADDPERYAQWLDDWRREQNG